MIAKMASLFKVYEQGRKGREGNLCWVGGIGILPMGGQDDCNTKRSTLGRSLPIFLWNIFLGSHPSPARSNVPFGTGGEGDATLRSYSHSEAVPQTHPDRP